MKGKRYCVLMATLISFLTIQGLILSNKNVSTLKAQEKGVDIVSISEASDWFHVPKTEDQGTWSVSGSEVTVDAPGGGYAFDGANYITGKGVALGTYEFSSTIHIEQLYQVQNPMVGVIPWYVDESNYIYVQLKFTDSQNYLLSNDEKTDGYGIEQIICSGKFNGESKYYTATTQQENTVYDALNVASLKSAKLNPTNQQGHRIGVKFENNSATATSYSITITYNDVTVGQTYAYFYNSIAKNAGVGFMAQDVKATFKNTYINDFYAENNTYSLARDWKENNGYIYRVLNGQDVWTFNEDQSISFVTDEKKEGNKVVSGYKVSGSNIAGYDTNRGFIDNPNSKDEKGLPQNYELSASFKLDENPTFTGKQITQGYGLLAWYQDDQNFVDVTFRRTIKGLKAAPEYVNEVVLYGWIERSSTNVGQNVYTLPDDFDFSVNHKLTVAKKSTGFYVYLDDGQEPIIQKNVKGTNLNSKYGYTGYNAKFTGTKLESRAIYSPYDEISVLDEDENQWRASASSADGWKFEDGHISISAKENSNELTHRSYIIGSSDISDKNMAVEIEANVELGSASYSELMLSPYMVDADNYARIGLIFENGKTYAAIRSSTYTEDDIEEGNDPQVVVRRSEISNIDLSNTLKLKAEKVEETLVLYVNDQLVYGKEIENIGVKSEDYGLYLYNMDIDISKFETIGYKKYTKTQVGDWLTSGMKYNAWTIDENGYLNGDGTYTPEMEHDDDDSERNWAIKDVTVGDNYEMTVDIIATDQTEAEDRVGVMMWYLDDDNFMVFYLDRWRADSTVPRTTIYGNIDGETLPVTYNHGGWLREGDALTSEGISITESSQVTHWHTIKIIKEGNTFTCYIDDISNGYISYNVAAGLPSTQGKTLYAGIYTLNDAVQVRSYDVTAVGGFTNPTLPAEAGNPQNAYVPAPTLQKYEEKIAKDAFDGNINTVGGKAEDDPEEQTSGSTSEEPSVEPQSEQPSTPAENSSKPEEGKKKGCKGEAGSIFALLVVGLGLMTLKRKNK